MRQKIELPNGRIIFVRWWQVAILALVVSGITRLLASKSTKESQKFYSRKLRQAPWSPPGWLFGPAWTVNNFFLLRALIKILGSKSHDRKTLLLQQLFIWVIFFSFDYVYFKKKSPLLAAIWTKAESVFAVTSLIMARHDDTVLSNCYIPLAIWTSFASTIADYQALYNSDPLFGTKPLIEYFNK